MPRRLAFGLVTALAASGLAVGAGLAAGQDVNCKQFTYQEDAQRYLLPGDPYDLDRDGDGVACQSLPRRGSTIPAPTTNPSGSTAPSATVAPKPTPSSGTTAGTAAPAAPRPALPTAALGSVSTLLGRIAALGCSANFNRDLGVVSDLHYDLIRAGLSAADNGRIIDARHQRLETLNYCIGSYTAKPAAARTADDGSTAATSGSQVTDVPAGHADTGRP